MRHVDIVRNEWAAGRQVRVARLVMNGKGVALAGDDLATWEPIVLQEFLDAKTGEAITPENGERFLEHLHEHVRGDYLFATVAHDDSACEFKEEIVAIESQTRGGVPA